MLTDNTKPAEISKAVEIIASVSKDMPLVLVPASAHGKIKSVKSEDIYAFVALARKKLKYVNFLPQMHKLWGIQ